MRKILTENVIFEQTETKKMTFFKWTFHSKTRWEIGQKKAQNLENDRREYRDDFPLVSAFQVFLTLICAYVHTCVNTSKCKVDMLEFETALGNSDIPLPSAISFPPLPLPQPWKTSLWVLYPDD